MWEGPRFNWCLSNSVDEWTSDEADSRLIPITLSPWDDIVSNDFLFVIWFTILSENHCLYIAALQHFCFVNETFGCVRDVILSFRSRLLHIKKCFLFFSLFSHGTCCSSQSILHHAEFSLSAPQRVFHNVQITLRSLGCWVEADAKWLCYFQSQRHFFLACDALDQKKKSCMLTWDHPSGRSFWF